MTILEQETIELNFCVSATQKEIENFVNDEQLKDYVPSINIRKINPSTWELSVLVLNTSYKSWKYIQDKYFQD